MTVTPAWEDLFRPGHIAVVGASGGAAWHAGILTRLRHHGFSGRLSVVNPHRDEVEGIRTHPDLAEVPGDVDVVLVALGGDAATSAAAAAGARGARLTVLLSTGMPNAAPCAASARSGPRLLGPGSLGFVNVLDGVAASWSRLMQLEHLAPGNVAFVSESGGIGGCLAERAMDAGIGMAHIVWTGSNGDLTTTEVARILMQDERVGAIAILMEQATTRAELSALATESRRRGTPVCIAKYGRSRRARRAVDAHSGALAGSHRAFAAVCRALGIPTIDDETDLLPAAAVLARYPRAARGNRMFAFGGSGGANVVLGDALSAAWEMPAPSPGLSARIETAAPPGIAITNPLDLTAGYGDDRAAAVRDLVLASREYDVVVEALTMVEGDRALARAATIAASADSSPIPLLVYWPAGGLAATARRLLAERNIWPATRAGTVDTIATAVAGDRPVDSVAATERGGDPVPAHRAGEIRRLIGLDVPPSALVATAAEAEAAAARIGWPVVLKATGAAHKTETEGVRLGLVSRRQVRAAFAVITERHPSPLQVAAHVDAEVELFLGTYPDPDYGPLLIVGFGGVAVEVDPDTAMLACPASADAVRRALLGLRRRALLDGFRGRAPIDVEPYVAAAVRLSQLAPMLGSVAVEFNPVVCRPDGRVIALDELVAAVTSPPES